MSGNIRRQWKYRNVTLDAILLCCFVGVFFGVSAFTFEAAKGWSYLSDDPLTCVNCHIMRDQYDSWQKSSHHSFATCNSCHVPHDPVDKWLVKAENGFRHSWAFTFQDFHEPIQAREASRRVVERNCRDCHEELTSAMTLLDAPAEADLHSGALSCLHCHGAVGHGAGFATNN